jgi:DNA-binding transcriptional LysR family regulator
VPLLARWRAKHPVLSIELFLEARVADLARGEADICIRIVRSASAAVVSKLLGRAEPDSCEAQPLGGGRVHARERSLHRSR